MLAADRQSLVRLLLLLLLLGSPQLLLPAVLCRVLALLLLLLLPHLPALPRALATDAAASSTAALLPD
jgi:hypothetical protein